MLGRRRAATACGNGAQSFTLARGRALDPRARRRPTIRQRGSVQLGRHVPHPRHRARQRARRLLQRQVAGVRLLHADRRRISNARSTASCSPTAARRARDNRGSKRSANLADGVHTFRVRARDGGEFDRVPDRPHLDGRHRRAHGDPRPDLRPRRGRAPGGQQGDVPIHSERDRDLRVPPRHAPPSRRATPASSLERLTAGAHRFEVRAVDRAGNVGTAAARVLDRRRRRQRRRRLQRPHRLQRQQRRRSARASIDTPGQRRRRELRRRRRGHAAPGRRPEHRAAPRPSR